MEGGIWHYSRLFPALTRAYLGFHYNGKNHSYNVVNFQMLDLILSSNEEKITLYI